MYDRRSDVSLSVSITISEQEYECECNPNCEHPSDVSLSVSMTISEQEYECECNPNCEHPERSQRSRSQYYNLERTTPPLRFLSSSLIRVVNAEWPFTPVGTRSAPFVS